MHDICPLETREDAHAVEPKPTSPLIPPLDNNGDVSTTEITGSPRKFCEHG